MDLFFWQESRSNQSATSQGHLAANGRGVRLAVDVICRVVATVSADPLTEMRPGVEAGK